MKLNQLTYFFQIRHIVEYKCVVIKKIPTSDHIQIRKETSQCLDMVYESQQQKTSHFTEIRINFCFINTLNPKFLRKIILIDEFNTHPSLGKLSSCI